MGVDRVAVANAAESGDHDDLMLAGNREALGPVGEDLGTPGFFELKRARTSPVVS